MSCHTIITPTIEFPSGEIANIDSKDGLLSIEIEISLRCNFRCPYCYLPDKEALQDELTLAEIKSIVDQAKALGAVKIIILGGEPMLHPDIIELITYIHAQSLDIEVFTNGYSINTQMAQFLFEKKVNVVLKMNTFDVDLQNQLCGHKKAHETIHAAFNSLLASGYPSKAPFLAVSTVICKQNYSELVEFWCWLRDQDILPYFEIITPQGEALENNWMEVDVPKLEKLFHDIAKVDQVKYHKNWDIQPPLLGSKCLRHQFSCLVKSNGDVTPCVGVPVVVGNIRETALKGIISSSEVIQNLRQFEGKIKGPCGSCPSASNCYGCRGAAYNVTGDYLESDPLCWHNQDKLDEILHLPVDATPFIPHTAPILAIDQLCTVGEKKLTANYTVKENELFLDRNNLLDPTFVVEMMAQTIAAGNGFINRNKPGASKSGFLLGLKNFTIHKAIALGDKLRIEVEKTAQFGEFAIIYGKIYNTQSNELVAEGEQKVYQKS